MSEIERGYEFIRAIQGIRESIKQNYEKRFSKLNLTAPQGMLIALLGHNGEMRVSEISQKMGLSNSTVSGIIDRLEKQGYVTRVNSKEDRRVVLVNVTEEFRDKFKCAYDQEDIHLTKVAQLATPEELDRITNGFKTLQDVMNRANTHQDGKE